MDIIGKKHYFFGLSIILILCGVVGFFAFGLKLDIQFQGGTVIQIEMPNEKFDTDKVEDIVRKVTDNEISAQHSTAVDPNNPGKKINLLVLNMATKENVEDEAGLNKEISSVVDAVKKEYNIPDATYSYNSVQPFIGKETLLDGLKAIFWASLLIILYVWIRFNAISGLSAGVMAVVALFHDAAMVLATFILFRIPLNENFIAVVLTIIGYSINDTIVIYDRIRENQKLFGSKIPIGQLVNTSILQSLSRSINTSVATFMSIAVVYVFAQINNIESITSFALPMMIGIISGCYSTIFIAGPLWVMWKEHKQKKRLAARAKA